MSNISENHIPVKDFMVNYAAGGISATIPTALSHPIDVIKLRVHEYAKDGSPIEGISDICKRIAKKEGIFAFWRGFLPSWLIRMNEGALSFASKDFYRTVISFSGIKNAYWRSLLENLAAGGAAGATALSIMYPFDLIYSKVAINSFVPESKRQYKGVFDCMSKIYQANGPREFYKGFVYFLPYAVLYRSCYFGLYDTLNENWLKEKKTMVTFSRVSLVYLVALFSARISYPLSTVAIRVKMESSWNPQPLRYFSYVKQIIEKEGVRSLFRGASADKAISSALTLFIYDYIQR